ncbi:MAG: class I SAM-dependent methyltransferase [Desertimonas sp.]
MPSLDDDLRAYYDAEAEQRAARDPGPMRTALRDGFVRRLRDEGRDRIVECGGGTGHDANGFAGDGIDVVSTDLTHRPLAISRDRGTAVVQASMLALPFVAHEFAAGWTMSTFVHITDDRVDRALDELVRVVEPSGLIGIGTWGGRDSQFVSDRDVLQPPRLFCRRRNDRWREMLGRHAEVLEFTTHDTDETAGTDWGYQFAVLRTPS